jgi:uncharacterized phage protein (TIGR02216 family)
MGERGLFGEAASRLWTAASVLLGWRPDEFWNATPAELAAALNMTDGAADGPDRETIDELKRRFPDQ